MKIPRKCNGLPILNNEQLEDLAEKYALDFCPDIAEHPRPLDVELFIEQYLGFNYELHYLSSCEAYLGMTVFEDMKIPTFNAETFKAQFSNIPANTIIIDSQLVRRAEFDGHFGRCRFTQAHECGHAILHPEFYKSQSGNIRKAQESLKAYSTGESHMAQEILSDADRAEQQANSFASYFLMPRCAVDSISKSRASKSWEDFDYIELIKETFNVSWDAAFYRLKGMGILETSLEKFDWDAFQC